MRESGPTGFHGAGGEPQGLELRCRDGRRRALRERAQKRLDDLGVELHALPILELAHGVFHRKRRAIGPDTRHCVERVRHADEPRFERDLIAFQAVGGAGAIDPLVMRAHDRERAGRVAHQRTQNARPDHRMLHDVAILGVGQLARLVQHALTDANLANVMELGAERDGVDEIFIQVESARDLDGIIGHAHRVPARVRVFRFEREDKRMHALEEQLFDATRLRLDAPNEHATQPRLVVDHKAAHSGEGWHRRPKYRSLAPWGSRPYVPAMTRVAERDLTHRIATRAVHAGYLGDPLSGAVMTPIYQTSTYIQEGLGRNKGYEYARTRNPTREALERNVAALEGGVHGFAFGSGLAALDAVMKLLSAGDHVVSGENVYGGSHRQMTHIWSRMGLTFAFVDGGDAQAVAAAVTPNTKIVYAETPTNPMMRLCDLKTTGEIARKAKALFVVDNTFATPYFQQPLQFGADIVLHSTTKYLNGHSDMVGGMLVTTRDDIAERIGFIQNSSGAVPGPFDCWLALRGTKTLALRMRQHDANGRRVAEWLEKHPRIARGYYPGLRSHPQHELAARQMKGFGGMLSIELGDTAFARRFVERTKIFALAESLGGVESLIGHPASMTHASVPPEMRRRMGLTDSLVRLSVGIEDVEDLVGGLDQALARDWSDRKHAVPQPGREGIHSPGQGRT